MRCPDILGLPWDEAEGMLLKSGAAYRVDMTRPTKDFFETNDKLPYVVRVKFDTDGILKITLANRLAKS